jgi:CheY-like chemotaxis protein
VRARSEGEGRGATIECVLPLIAQDAAGPLENQPDGGAGAGDPAPGAGGSGAAPRVLVADDHPDAAQALAEVLALEGHQVRTAFDGLAARATAQEWRPDAMVLDLGMPGLTGDALARWVRAQPWGTAVRLIAITGWGPDTDGGRVRSAGFDVHLVKPVQPALLLQAVWPTQRDAA